MITSNGGGAAAAVELAEGQTLVTDVVASGAPGSTVTYAITGGADVSRFAIDPRTGRLSFVEAPDFEQPGDSDGDNVYEVIVSASDGGFTDTQTLSVSVADRSVAPRLIAPDGFAGGIGGSTAVFLTTGFQDIRIIDAPGTITLSGPPGGDDIIRFDGDASAFTITRVGSRVEIADGDTMVSIPVSPTGINVVFADGPRTLAIVGSEVRIGGQVVSAAATAITAPAEPGPLPDLADPAVRGRLIVAEGSPVIVDGNVDVFGTNFDAESLTIAGGDVAIRGGFTGGDDIISFTGPASDFTATRVGSTVIIEGGDTRVSIPISPEGVKLSFADGDQLLRIDTDTGQIVLGDLVITNTPQQLGAPGTSPVIDLADLDGSNGFVIPGLAEGDLTGRSVASAGDVNGDGIDDLIIGALGADAEDKSLAGISYVLFGKVGGFGASFDLASVNGANGFAILGADAFDSSGFDVSSAGDVNGDGLGDLIIGAPFADPNAPQAGESYVVFGRASGFGASLDLASLNGSDGFRIEGINRGDESGFAVSSAGDVNGDGFDDLVIGAHRADADGMPVAGESYVLFGSDAGFGASIDLAVLNSTNGFRIDGIAAGDQSGFSVSAAGDVNGDGIADLVIGSPGADRSESGDAGAAYVLFGRTTGFGSNFDLSTLDGTNGFALSGIAASDNAGFAVSTAGDLNGDGFDDLVIGAIFADGTAGASYVVFGSGAGFAPNLDLASLNGINGFRLGGIDIGDQAGFAVSSAGDLNGDGFDDLVVGARFGDPAAPNAGEAYVILGKAGGFDADLDLASLNGRDGFRVDGIDPGEQAGFDVASAGDLDGDGFDDLVIGAPFADVGSATNAGEGYVIFGGNTGTEVTAPVIKAGAAGPEQLIGNAGNDSISNVGAGDVVRGGAGNDRIGAAATSFAEIRGGRGFDTLGLDGAGITLDFTGEPGLRVDSIEAIDLTGTGNNRLVVDERSIARLSDARSDGRPTLIVNGDEGDEIEAIDFVPAGTEVIGGITYNVFEKGNVRLLAEVGIAVTVNNPPVIVSDTVATALENQTLAYTAVATDPEGDAVSFSLTGADAALFNIDSATGVVTFKTAPNFEAPADSNGDNQYQIVVTASDGEDSSDQAVTITVANVNEAPTVTSGATATVDENQTAAYTATASDSDAGTVLTYSLSGTDADLFNIDSATGVVTFKAAPNFEAPSDAGGNNRYDFIVTATDAGGLSGDQAVTITVANVNEAPTVTSGAAATVNENQTAAYTAMASDPDAGTVLSYSLSGTDANLFNIDSATGVVTFKTAPNFEAPADAGGNNQYNFTVTASDGSLSDDQAVTITVANVNEAPTAVVLNNQLATRAENSPSGAAVKVADIVITDDALGTETVTLSGTDAAFFEVVGSELRLRAGTALNFEAKSSYNVTVNVADLTLPGSTPVTANYTLTVTDVNEAPTAVALNNQLATRAENSPSGAAVKVADIAITDDALGTETVTLSGTDAAFFEVVGSELRLKAGTALNFEAKSSYSVTVNVADTTIAGSTPVTADYTLTVTDVNEAPSVTSGATATVDENQTAAYTTTATDPDAGTTFTYSLSGTDANLFNIDSTTGVVTFKVAPNFEAPADNGGNNQYEITVRATDDGNPALFDDQAVTITVADVQEQLIFDLTTLTAGQGFIIQGDTAADRAGFSVSNAGDVNGDGFDDLIVGALYGDDGGSDAGEAYVVFGSASGFGTAVGGRQVIDLTSLAASQGFIIQGDMAEDSAGRSVSSAGDVNGDGFDDLIIGAVFGDDGGNVAGEAYVVFGGASGFGSPDGAGRRMIDLTSLTASQGFIIQGDSVYDQTGRSVSSAGDVNGDGFDDLIVGADGGDDGGNAAGEAYVLFGGASGFGTAVGGRQVVDLTTLASTQGFIIQGDEEADNAGYSVSSAGDVNGDGFDDLIVGAFFGDNGGNAAGEAYVVFGGASGFGTAVGGRQVIDLTSLTASQGFIIQGDAAEDTAGISVSSAGDVNGDGFDDLIIGAFGGDDGGSNAGEAYVVFGSASSFGTAVGGRQVIDLTSFTASQGFIIQGDASGDFTGFSVSSAGDVNGDGLDDVIVGADLGDDGGANAGEAYVVFGSASGFGTAVGGRQVIDLSSLIASQGFIIQGDAAYDQAGRSVSSAGDVNGDGFDDLIVGAYLGDGGGSAAGEAYVVFGGATGTEDTTPVNRSGTAATDNFTGNAGDDTFTGIAAGDVVRGGAGDDSIAITATNFADISGGRGTDTLALAGTGLSLNLTTTPRPRLDSIEVIDLTGTGNNSLTVSELAIYQLTEERSGGEATLIVEGNAGDSVDAQDFIVSGTQMLGGVTYNLFEKGNANLLVAQGVTVTGANNRPVANDDSGTANEDNALVVSALSTTVGASGLLTNDTDLDNDLLTITAVNGAAGNVGTQITLASGALLTVNADGSYNYNPNGQFAGLRSGETDTDSFTYTISDGQLSDTASVTVTIEGADEAPVVATTIADQAFDEDTAVNFTVPAGTFTDADSATLTYSAELSSGAALPSWLDFDPATRTFSGTPPTDFNGVFDIRVTASDGALSANDVFRLTINPINDAPVGVPDTLMTDEDQAISFTPASLVANDTDVESNAISVVLVENAVNGTLSFISGNLIFTPSANFFGTASFTYRPRDSLNAVGLSTTVTVTVNPVNDAPSVANPIANRAFDEDTAVNFTVPANVFADVDSATLTYSAELSGGGALPSWLSFDATTRTFSGTPTPLNFNGVFDIEVIASDGEFSVTDVFTLTITPVNDAPDATNGTASTDEDTAVTVVAASGLLAGVTDVDGPSLAITQINGQAVTFGTPITLTSGALLTVQSTGAYVYNPNGQFEALRPGDTGNDSFTFTVSDGSLTDTATISVTIAGRNEVPIAGNDTLSMTGNTPITITGASLLLNDSDPDGSPTTAITLTAVGGATNGAVVLNGDGSITFTPTTGYTGPASFTYTITDADSATATGTVNITVSGLVWYVDNSFAGVSDGSFARPFTSLAPLNGTANDGSATGDRDGTGDTIFIARNGTAYTGGITLEEGQKLFGDGYEFEVNGIDIGGSVTANSTINHSSYGITLNSGNVIRGLDINGTATSAVGIQDGNGTVGDLTIAGVSVSGDGKAVDIDQGGNLAVTIDTLSSTNSTSEGVHLQGVTGSFVATTGIIQSATNQGFLIGAAGGGIASSGGNATITYGGIIYNFFAGGTSIEIQDRTGGTVTFSGEISHNDASSGIVADGNAGTINFNSDVSVGSQASTAISLTNNTAAINFNPTEFGLRITTTTGNGFIVDGGGGTVTLTGTGSFVETISGRAVEIDGVTIGTGGVNFQSVTVTNGNSTTGIFLRNAGSGGFNITGTASDAGSGGTISSIDGGTNATIEDGIGIYIENTNNISLSNIDFTGNFGDFGIRGNTVNNFTLRDSTFDGADSDDGGFGDSSGDDEGVIRFTGLTGTALLEGNNISDGHEDVLRIDNSSGTLNLTIRSSADDNAIIGRNGTTSGNDGIIVNGSGASNITVLIDGVQFTGSRGDIIQTEANGTATQNITIRNSTFANLHPDVVSGGGGVTIGLSGGTGAGPGVTYNVDNNTFTGAEGTVILVGAIGPVGSMTGTILNNDIGTANNVHDNAQASAGSNNGGGGIAVRVEKLPGSGSLTSAVRIEGNSISDVDGDGIFLRSNGASDGSGTARLEATIRNNTIAELGAAAFGGIFAQIGGGGGSDDGLLGLDIANNTINTNGATNAVAAIAFDDGANDSQFYLPGFVGSPTDANVLAFLTATKGNTLTVTSPVEPFLSLATGPYLTGTNFSLSVPLMIEPGTTGTGSGVQATLSALEALREAAVQLWTDAGASDAQIAAMRAVELSVADLYGGFIGQTNAGGITIDIDAAGIGWFIDATPFANEEFVAGPDGLTALSGSEAAGGIDLLTAIAHELGHIAGLDDLYGSDVESVMDGFLAAGERNLPEAITAPAVGGGSTGEAAGSGTMLLAELVSGPASDAVSMMPAIVLVDAHVL